MAAFTHLIVNIDWTAVLLNPDIDTAFISSEKTLLHYLDQSCPIQHKLIKNNKKPIFMHKFSKEFTKLQNMYWLATNLKSVELLAKCH